MFESRLLAGFEHLEFVIRNPRPVVSDSDTETVSLLLDRDFDGFGRCVFDSVFEELADDRPKECPVRPDPARDSDPAPAASDPRTGQARRSIGLTEAS